MKNITKAALMGLALMSFTQAANAGTPRAPIICDAGLLGEAGYDGPDDVYASATISVALSGLVFLTAEDFGGLSHWTKDKDAEGSANFVKYVMEGRLLSKACDSICDMIIVEQIFTHTDSAGVVTRESKNYRHVCYKPYGTEKDKKIPDDLTGGILDDVIGAIE